MQGGKASKKAHLVQVSLSTGTGFQSALYHAMGAGVVVLEIVRRAWHVLPKCSLAELYPQTQAFLKKDVFCLSLHPCWPPSLGFAFVYVSLCVHVI